MIAITTLGIEYGIQILHLFASKGCFSPLVFFLNDVCTGYPGLLYIHFTFWITFCPQGCSRRVFGSLEEALACCKVVHIQVYHFKWSIVCGFGKFDIVLRNFLPLRLVHFYAYMYILLMFSKCYPLEYTVIQWCVGELWHYWIYMMTCHQYDYQTLPSDDFMILIMNMFQSYRKGSLLWLP